MGTWTTKFRKPALIAGVVAMGLAVNPAIASSEGQPDDQAFERCVEIRLESMRSLASN